jgi:hypothetical protein
VGIEAGGHRALYCEVDGIRAQWLHHARLRRANRRSPRLTCFRNASSFSRIRPAHRMRLPTLTVWRSSQNQPHRSTAMPLTCFQRPSNEFRVIRCAPIGVRSYDAGPERSILFANVHTTSVSTRPMLPPRRGRGSARTPAPGLGREEGRGGSLIRCRREKHTSGGSRPVHRASSSERAPCTRLRRDVRSVATETLP